MTEINHFPRFVKVFFLSIVVFMKDEFRKYRDELLTRQFVYGVVIGAASSNTACLAVTGHYIGAAVSALTAAGVFAFSRRHRNYALNEFREVERMVVRDELRTQERAVAHANPPKPAPG